MPLNTTGTILTLTNASTDATPLLPFYSARRLKQTWAPVDQAFVQADTINGETFDMSIPQFRKLRSTISATDVAPPSRDDVSPGLIVLVGCAFYLSFPIGGAPSRPVVSGSEVVEGSFTFYRPMLRMMIGKMSYQFDEWEAGNFWSIDLREVVNPNA